MLVNHASLAINQYSQSVQLSQMHDYLCEHFEKAGWTFSIDDHVLMPYNVFSANGFLPIFLDLAKTKLPEYFPGVRFEVEIVESEEYGTLAGCKVVNFLAEQSCFAVVINFVILTIESAVNPTQSYGVHVDLRTFMREHVH
jgi:hypothetical protein